METGIGIFNGISFERQAELFVKHGVKRTFIASETPDFDKVMGLFQENGIICETLHAPFTQINDMWGEDEEKGTAILKRLKDSVDKCERYNIPVTIVHVSSGRPMVPISDAGIRRYSELFEYAKKKNVTIALENLRYLENLKYFMDNFQEPGFCWDTGHENCYTKDVDYMKLFGKRTAALHIHDNRCGDDTDDHLIPFDGNIDFDAVARSVAESGYRGTIMFEVGKHVNCGEAYPYINMTDEAYFLKAKSAAERIAAMVESYSGK